MHLIVGKNTYSGFKLKGTQFTQDGGFDRNSKVLFPFLQVERVNIY